MLNLDSDNFKEDFRVIRGYEEYIISNKGYVISTKRRKLLKLKPSLDTDGYEIVGLHSNGKTKTKSIHRLVAENFLGESKLQVNHKDFNKRNNRLDNLEFVTMEENLKWSYLNGRKLYGEKNPKSKLDWAKVLTILTLKHLPHVALSKYYGLTPEGVAAIRKGRNWILFKSYKENP